MTKTGPLETLCKIGAAVEENKEEPGPAETRQELRGSEGDNAGGDATANVTNLKVGEQDTGAEVTAVATVIQSVENCVAVTVSH